MQVTVVNENDITLDVIPQSEITVDVASQFNLNVDVNSNSDVNVDVVPQSEITVDVVKQSDVTVNVVPQSNIVVQIDRGVSNSQSGGVTSVAMTVPSLLSVAGSPITSSGTLEVSYSGTPLPVVNGGFGNTDGSVDGGNY